MGNFSRETTFDPNKKYVAVRLQQGVPLVDADWNEMNDVIRHELYDGLNMAFPDGIIPETYEDGVFKNLQIQPTSDNDLLIYGGRVLIRGRPITIDEDVHYSSQPWTNPVQADQDGVDVIPLLTTPEAGRIDIVYLDVWEREVDSTEDDEIINDDIGIETCVRLKREVAVRVTEDRTTLPPAPDGHFFMLLALLHRQEGEARITHERIEDLRPFLHGLRGTREASFFPAFLPIAFSPTPSPSNPWLVGASVCAVKKPKDNSADGLLPLILPDGACMTHLKVRGYTRGPVEFALLRIRHEFPPEFTYFDEVSIHRIRNYADVLVEQTIQPSSVEEKWAFNESFPIPTTDRKNIVDNRRYYYGLCAGAEGDFWAIINGISIQYQY